MPTPEDSWSEREAEELLDELIQRDVLPENVECRLRTVRSEKTDLHALRTFLEETERRDERYRDG